MTQLSEEMIRMNRYLSESINKWQAELTPILQKVQDHLHWLALPYHTMALSRVLGSTVDDAARLGAIFRLFILSDYIHAMVRDDHEGQVYDEALQFHILIGDLLYGSALGLLCQKSWDKLLPLLADMIVKVNEGHALVLNGHTSDPVQIASLEWGSYYGAAFSAAGLINNLHADQVKRLDNIGLKLGLSIATGEMGSGNIRVYFNRFREGMDGILSNLSIGSYYQRMDIWTADTSLPVPAAG